MRIAATAVWLCALVAGGSEAGDTSWVLELSDAEIHTRVQQLEADPLGKDANVLRSVLVTYFDEIDLTFEVCTTHLKPMLNSRPRSHKDLWLHLIIATGDHLLSNPDQLSQTHVYQLAGLERVIDVYDRMIQHNSKLVHPFMEDLRARREDGTLAEFVRSSKCD